MKIPGSNSQKFRFSSLAVIIILLMQTSVPANMRAPYHREYRSSSGLTRIEGVTLLSEKISFEFDRYFTGNAGAVSGETNYCTVKAVYRVISDINSDTQFEFISPSAEAASAMVNNLTSSVSVNELEKTPESSQESWAMFYRDLYSLKFSGNLKDGENTISVTYRQPLSVSEISYGYFRKSRWSTGAAYEFAPIKEWKRAGSFNAEVELSVPYRRSVMDYISGDDIELNATGVYNDMKVKIEPEKSGAVIVGRNIVRKFRFTSDLPDKLFVSVLEH